MANYVLPSYQNAGVERGKVISLDTFLRTVHSAGEAFLSHDGKVTKFNPSVPETLPTKGSTPGFDSSVWKYSVAELRSDLSQLENNFRTDNAGKVIHGEKTWNFLCEYFFQLCRIVEYKYSYFQSTDSSTPTQTEYFGLGNTYYTTLANYKTAVVNDGIRTKCGVQQGLLINANGIASNGATAAIELLCSFNAKQEIVHDFGNRNKLSSKRGSHYLSTCYAAAATQVWAWWSTLEAPARAWCERNGYTYITVSTEVTGWYAGITRHEAYVIYSYSVAEAVDTKETTYKMHDGESVTLNILVDYDDDAEGNPLPPHGIVDPEPGIYRYKVKAQPDVVTITAQPDQHCRFICWNNDTSLSSTTYTVSMSGNKTVTARFAEGEYLIKLRGYGPGGGADLVGFSEALPSDTWACKGGTSVSAVAYPADYWHFDCWKNADTGDVIGSTNPLVWTVESDVAIVAEFQLDDARPVLQLHSVNRANQENPIDQRYDAMRDIDQAYWLRVKPYSTYESGDIQSKLTGWAKVFDISPDRKETLLVSADVSTGEDWITYRLEPTNELGHRLAVEVSLYGGHAEVWSREFPETMSMPSLMYAMAMTMNNRSTKFNAPIEDIKQLATAKGITSDDARSIVQDDMQLAAISETAEIAVVKETKKAAKPKTRKRRKRKQKKDDASNENTSSEQSM